MIRKITGGFGVIAPFTLIISFVKHFRNFRLVSKKGSSGIPSRGGKKSTDPSYVEYRQTGGEGKQKEPSLLGTTTSCFGPTFALAGIYKLISDIITFVSPQILK